MRSPEKGKLPWMKFYPADWRADPALRMCSLAARGLWMEMLSIMHEANPRGSLLINGNTVGFKQLASLCGAPLRETVALLHELEAAGVFSRAEDGTIFSRRMKRDDEKAAQDKANGKAGGNPQLNAGVNPRDKAQRPEARSQNSESRIQNPERKIARTRACLPLDRGRSRTVLGSISKQDRQSRGHESPRQSIEHGHAGCPVSCASSLREQGRRPTILQSRNMAKPGALARSASGEQWQPNL